ncbi:pentapeptide repeat-containing protein [Actinomadura barringtoniae]|uniref:Pentapeptide repeat-containing protein n=1 Tax=Actinomadura barringtoniae TaxID=1427535 RepID=A0A939PLC4_9ACTN|nr:pentapeptide repeat-containing protein [Actinomadura barringtoniae]MBO2454198.1 pentapeptide repeat-containing protein [Actinomadura barringtoniae]
MRARSATIPPARAPKEPKLPKSLAAATEADTELAHDGKYLSLEYGQVTVTGDGAEDIEFERCRFNQTRFSGVTAHRAGFADVVFQGCDLANGRLFSSRIFNATVSNCRMTGLHMPEGGLRDVVFDGCRIDLASFRFTHLKDVVFRDCNLAESNFQQAELQNVRFERCKLVATQFSNVSMNAVRFAGCDLNGVRGITSFDGAIVSSADAMSLLHALASALGITIED